MHYLKAKCFGENAIQKIKIFMLVSATLGNPVFLTLHPEDCEAAVTESHHQWQTCFCLTEHQSLWVPPQDTQQQSFLNESKFNFVMDVVIYEESQRDDNILTCDHI